MSFHDPSLAAGAETVARLDDLSEPERRFVSALRLWLNGPEMQAEVWRDFAKALGTERGRDALHAFEALLLAIADGVERKLWRHRAQCPRLGRDEAALAAIVRLSATGDRSAAQGEAAAFARPAACADIVERAAEFGRLIGMGAARAWEGPAPRDHGFRVLH